MRENNTHQLSRNEILRIMGLSGRVSGLANSVESIRAALRDENGKLARYYTSITQNADEIKLLAARETESEEAVAELTIKYNNIESTVQTNKRQTDAALGTLTTNLQNEINARVAADSAQDDVFATYKSQTDRSISSIAAHWDANDHLIGYSTTTQTADMIKTKVEAYGYQTASQVDGRINNSTKWNSYTTTEQLPDKISQTVTASYIANTGALNGYAKTTDLPDMSLYYNKSYIDQMEDDLELGVKRVEQEIVSIADVGMWEQGDVDTDADAGSTYDQIKESYARAIRYKNLVAVNTETSFLLSSTYRLRFAYFNSSQKLTRIGSAVSPNTYGLINVNANSSEPYVAVVVYHSQGSAMSPSSITSTGICMTKDNVVTSAYLSLYVDKQSVSWLTGSADIVIFNFNNRFQIQHQGTAVLEVKANGDLEITGTLKPYSNIGTINPIQIDSSGNINRKAPDGSVIPLYAGRYVRYLDYGNLPGRTYTMSADDDYMVCNGNYSDKKIYLPYSPSQGKTVSIKNVGGVTRLYTSNSNHTIRKTDTPETQPVDINNYDRAELVYHSGAWRWNVMSV